MSRGFQNVRNAKGKGVRLQTGIGRPVSAEWARDFEHAFRHLAGPHYGLAMRAVPGVVYIDPIDYANVRHNPTYLGEQTEQWAKRDIDKGVELMCKAGILKASANRPIRGLPLAQDLRARKRNDTTKAMAQIADRRTEDYEGGFMISGERQAINEALSAPNWSVKEASNREVPIIQIGLGTIYSYNGPVRQPFMTEVTELVNSTVILEPVGAIRLEGYS